MTYCTNTFDQIFVLYRKPLKFGNQEEQSLGILDTKFKWLPIQKWLNSKPLSTRV